MQCTKKALASGRRYVSSLRQAAAVGMLKGAERMTDRFVARAWWLSGTAALALLATPATAQVAQEGTTPPANTPTGASIPEDDADGTSGNAATDGGSGTGNEVLVTGSRLRQDPNNSALPLQIITTQELSRNGISNPEQLIGFLTSNGTGPDNLASNADVVGGAQRGTNGLSAANLRGQGSAATLVLLNGRRVAAHGLSGAAVDVNQIPFAAIDRVEVLKDGASAIYGTDAVGGVINFITRKDYRGLGLQGFVDIPEQGGGEIYRVSGIAGFGDLADQGFNIMGAIAYDMRSILRGDQRDFVNGNQPNRGLSIDTRGTPIATAFGIAANSFQTPQGTLLTGLTLTAPNGANAVAGGINILDLPGGAGCSSVDGGMDYDFELWQSPTAFYACSWDTGRAVVLQQPIDTLTYYARGVVRIGGSHELSAEVTGSDASSAKIFSNNQLTANAGNFPWAYPLNARTTATYNQVFNAIRNAFPNPAQRAALDARYGRPIAGRLRCIACGNRELQTDTQTFRAAVNAEGPLFGDWNYHAGGSYSSSEATSILGSGYHFRGTLANGSYDTRAPTAPGAVGPGLVGLINSGILNPFSVDQSAEALAGLEAVSARGARLYGGKYELRQFDASIAGSLFAIWGGNVKAAIGVDYRRETYTFSGDNAFDVSAPTIFNAPADNANALPFIKRDVKAAYAEVLIPIVKEFEVTAAVRVDEYDGFGTTTNPKVAFKFQPWQPILVRGSYNTSFRVPTFNQQFNGLTVSPTNSGANIADPTTCPTPTAPNPANPGCALVTPDTITGGNPELGPETAEQFNLGVVFQPAPMFSASVDWWTINVENTIQLFTFREILTNANLFPERLIRQNGVLVGIDSRWANAGARQSQGLEVALRGGFRTAGDGLLSVGLDGTYWLKRRERLTANAPFSSSLIGVFTFTGDINPRWKHNLFANWNNDDFGISLTQIFRSGYTNQALPGIAAGTVTRPDFNPRVDDYVIYNAALSYNGLGPGFRMTLGVRNLFNTDPPFAVTYDSLGGSGSSWEPRVADPRGRSFTISVEAKF
jgi:iron complex outermembrane recepter protein